jgi:adenylate kinase
MLEDRYGIVQMSTGDMLRAAVREGTDVGRKAQAIMDRGALVPDDIIVKVMRERIGSEDCKAGYILDGFPRTLGQAEALDALLVELDQPLSAVIALIVPDEEVVRRLSGRRQCRACGMNYHVEFNAPAKEGICDACGGELYQRDDDNEQTVRQRLLVYNEQTSPLIHYYRERALLHEVDGVGSIDQIFGSLCSLIDKRVTRG